MLRTGVRTSITVSVLAPHRLAGQYLLLLLRKDPQCRPVLVDDLRSEGGPDSSIFLVDCGGLPLPVCQCLTRLKSRNASARCIVLDEKDLEVERMLKWGVHGSLAYPDVACSLTRAVRAVASGRIWVRSDLLQDYVQRSVIGKNRAPNALTDREIEIIEFVKKRMSNNEIASLLGIRNTTVKFHISNVLSKLQLSNRHDLQEEPNHDRAWAKFLWPSQVQRR
jgi:DNA-binding NarL/FixJ family response regulator